MKENEIAIPLGWKMAKLGDVGITITGKTPSQNNPDDWGNLVDFITPSDIVSDSKYLRNVTRKLSNEGVERFKKMIIPSRSVIVTCIGSDMGKVVINFNDALTNQQINSIKVNEANDTDFIYYTLRHSYILLRNSAVGGSTMPILNKTTFESLEILLPPLPEQKAIAEVLSSLDNKIELLREQNKTLEAIAQAIFKEWFVNFNYPDADGKPYRSSGGTLIDSELGPIPEGWSVGKLGQLIDVKDGTHDSPKASSTGYFLITSRHLQQCGLDFKNSYLISEEDFNQINRRSKVDRFDILISMIGTVGLLYFILEDEIDFAIKNVGLIKTSQKKELAEYIYLFMQSVEGIQRIQSSIAGTTQSYVTLETLRNIRITTPDDPTINKFNEISSSIFSKIHQNQSQIQTLSTLRDELLPKLMKGELRVKTIKEN